MHFQNQLDKAKEELKAGLKQKAANRLKNVINVFPDEMGARHMLAELYYNAGFLDMAGRYWYLSEPVSDEIKLSIEAYNKTINYSPVQALKDIKYRGDKSGLPKYAAMRLQQLESSAAAMGHTIPVFTSKKNIKPTRKMKNKLYMKLQSYFFKLIVLFLFISLIVGVITVFVFLFNL
ncbi:DUF6584 family protein [Flavobacterium sp.]|uniref:DUF6584 family protein n=1 Tax=Flavobacterium sp. TaxID=239 RepID=UPI0026030F3B|nr:DUF6584 family protein [Flavobacterium sp.]